MRCCSKLCQRLGRWGHGGTALGVAAPLSVLQDVGFLKPLQEIKSPPLKYSPVFSVPGKNPPHPVLCLVLCPQITAVAASFISC